MRFVPSHGRSTFNCGNSSGTGTDGLLKERRCRKNGDGRRAAQQEPL
jgi:hypothetical protein